MLKSHWRMISRFARIGDNLLIVAAFYLTYYFRDFVLELLTGSPLVVSEQFPVLGALEDYFIVLGIALPLYNAALSILGAYRSMRFSSFKSILRITFFSSGVAFLSTGFLLYLLKLDISRSFVAIFCILSGLLLFTERMGVLALLRFFRKQGKNYRNILIVGTGDQAVRLYKEIAKQPMLGVKVVGFADPNPANGGEQIVDGVPRVEQNGSTLKLLSSEHGSELLPAPVVATTDTFEKTLKQKAIDEVLLTNVSKHFAEIEELALIASEEGVRVTLVADLFSLEIFKSELSYFGNIPLIHYDAAPVDTGWLLVKRWMDVAIASALLILTSPVLLTIAVLVKLESPGPVLFKQRRVGLNGRKFVLLKFRSMVKGAERQLKSLKKQNEMTGPVFKMRDDPRVTKVGRFLRRYSLDELPQLINVIKGDMSIVGPRPPLPSEVSRYGRKQRRRLSMRPGLTCIWQVSGRNEIPDFEEWAKLDLEYIDNWSIAKDIVLMIKTVPAVLSGSGAR